MRLSLIIPCFNEESNIKKLVNKINYIVPKLGECEIILVNNGSKDNTYNKLIDETKKFSYFKVIDIKKNNGYGDGIYQGIIKSSGDIVAWTHADLQTDPEDIVTGYNLIKNKNKKTIIKGKRKNRSKLDVIFTYLMSKIVNIFSNSNLNDINAQPKFFYRNFLEYIDNPPKDFNLDLYILIKASRIGYKIIDFPVYFHKRNFGIAKGGGSIRGKIKLSYKTFLYILIKSNKI
jgi:dolichol-phosphate mannosyltransferase